MPGTDIKESKRNLYYQHPNDLLEQSHKHEALYATIENPQQALKRVTISNGSQLH